jgi:hypothetical protein
LTAPPAAKPISTSAEGPAPPTLAEVWVRDYDGAHARRISRSQADRLVSQGLADRVSAAGHVRLKLGIRFPLDGPAIHGLRAVERSRFYRGDAVTARDMHHIDHLVGTQ